MVWTSEEEVFVLQRVPYGGTEFSVPHKAASKLYYNSDLQKKNQSLFCSATAGYSVSRQEHHFAAGNFRHLASVFFSAATARGYNGSLADDSGSADWSAPWLMWSVRFLLCVTVKRALPGVLTSGFYEGQKKEGKKWPLWFKNNLGIQIDFFFFFYLEHDPRVSSHGAWDGSSVIDRLYDRPGLSCLLTTTCIWWISTRHLSRRNHLFPLISSALLPSAILPLTAYLLWSLLYWPLSSALFISYSLMRKSTAAQECCRK